MRVAIYADIMDSRYPGLIGAIIKSHEIGTRADKWAGRKRGWSPMKNSDDCYVCSELGHREDCLNVKSEERVVYKKAELNGIVDSENNHGGS